MKYKFLIKIIIVFLVIALFVMGVLLALKDPTKQPENQKNPGPTITIPTPKGNVTTQDFKQNPVEQVGDILALEENADFSIVYFSQDNYFLVTLRSQPVQQARDKAEEALLTKLGIGRGEACKLNVSLSVPFDVDQNLAGQDYGLSFCLNGLPF